MARFEASGERMASRVWRPLLIVAGVFFVAVGAIGIFVPLLPTTIFLLLAATCFGKSSPGAYRWLMGNRWFGSILREYHEGGGATLRTKATSMVLLWLGLTLAGWWVGNLWVDLVLIAIGVGVSVHLVRLRTVRA